MTSATPADRGLEAIERQRLRAIVQADVPTLELLHHPKFMLCTPSGAMWDRTTYLGGLADRSITYSRFEPLTPIEILCSGDLAVLRYRSTIDLITPSGGGHLECWHLDTYVRAPDNCWQCRWSQATDTIPPG